MDVFTKYIEAKMSTVLIKFISRIFNYQICEN